MELNENLNFPLFENEKAMLANGRIGEEQRQYNHIMKSCIQGYDRDIRLKSQTMTYVPIPDDYFEDVVLKVRDHIRKQGWHCELESELGAGLIIQIP